MNMTKLTINNFKHYYENLPASHQKGFINLICQGCDISEPTFYRWLNNPDQIKKPAKEKIAEIAGQTVNQLFTVKN